MPPLQCIRCVIILLIFVVTEFRVDGYSTHSHRLLRDTIPSKAFQRLFSIRGETSGQSGTGHEDKKKVTQSQSNFSVKTKSLISLSPLHQSTATKTFFGVRTVSQHLQLEQPDQRSELPKNAIDFRTVSLTYRAFFNSSRYQTKVQSGGSGPKRISSQGQPRAIQLLNPNRLKIVGGTAKGKKIDSPDVYLRPMMAKVPNDWI